MNGKLKLNKLAQNTIRENVTSISGVPTWTLVLFKRILEITGKNNIQEVWPNLELYIHGGVSFIPYREQFEKMIGGKISITWKCIMPVKDFLRPRIIRMKMVCCCLPDHGIFMEFMPVEEYGKEGSANNRIEGC